MTEKPEIDIMGALLALPFWQAIRIANTLLQEVSIRRLGEVCHEHGVEPSFAFIDRPVEEPQAAPPSSEPEDVDPGQPGRAGE